MYDITKSRQIIGDINITSEHFSVVTYNILADCHMKDEWYPFTPKEKFTSSQRHDQIMEELQVLDGDIVCLQEVGPKYFREKLNPSMTEIGYKGLLQCKVMGVDEGEATFTKQKNFN